MCINTSGKNEYSFDLYCAYNKLNVHVHAHSSQKHVKHAVGAFQYIHVH